MIKRCAMLLCILAASVAADTLTLRSGEVVTGSWISVDANRIRFMVNDEVKTYQRFDVVSVTFGSAKQETVPQPQPTGTIVPRSSNQPVRRPTQRSAPSMEPPPQRPIVEEPDVIGDVYFLNSSGQLAPLENVMSQVRRPARGPVPTAPHVYWEVLIAKSSVRFDVGNKIQFVVRLERGVNPDNFKLYLMNLTKESRRVMADARGNAPPARYFMEVAKYGETSYTLTPSQSLAVGEYCFSPSTSDRVSCFGVDPNR